MSQDNACANCRRSMGSHYQLTRVSASGATQVTAKVCSLMCLMRWSYTYTTQRSAQGVTMAKQMLSGLLDAIRSGSL